MFGVLVVKHERGIGYLAAYSGASANSLDNADSFFVPPIYTLPPHSIPHSKEESHKLQDYIFSQYNLLNAKGETKNLLEIFAETPLKYPPSGSGDCCEPKLLQYAYLNHLTPICMAQFWYGKSPKEEIRHHLSFYPACQGRCKPILSWMLQGLDVEPNPLDKANKELEEKLTVIYEDEWIMVVNKPSGMLSVSGKVHAPCVTDIIRDVSAVHRLDMFTSGLQILVKTTAQTAETTFKDMQHLFANRQIKKRYLALVEGHVREEKGTISIPLSSDYLNRPCQRIDYEHGKTAITDYEVIEHRENTTLLYLYPHTGRTHQLRIHCASPDGLGCPICGDRLYGPSSNYSEHNPQNKDVIRLHLQAQAIEFEHPITKNAIHLEISHDF